MNKIFGYTLLELITVVAIIGIAAAFAMNNYFSYVLRARMVELLSFAEFAKTAVSEVYMSTNVMPNNNQEANFTPMTDFNTEYVPNEKYEAKFKFVSVYQGGTILMYDYLFNYDISQNELISQNLVIVVFKPTINDGSLNWECGVPGDLVSDVEKIYQYLPSNCRQVLSYN